MTLSKLEIPDITIEQGYTNQTLYLNLSTNEIRIKPVSAQMKEKFIGGKGFDLWLMWNSLPKDRIVKWDDPENEICIASGPLGGGKHIPGSGKAIVTTISPLTDIIIDSNVGGYFAAFLKYAGFDAMEIQGKAAKEIIIYIDGENHQVTIEEVVPGQYSESSHLLTQELTEKYAPSLKEKHKISVITTGPAAKHTRWGMLNFSWYSARRKWASSKQAGRGGIGTVFANKNIKAIVVRSTDVPKDINPADLDLLKRISKEHTVEIIRNDPKQNEMRSVGTGHLPELMNEFDLFPVENYRYGKHHTILSENLPYHRDVWRKEFCDTGKGADGCWKSCALNCAHYVNAHTVLSGPYKGQKVIVDGPEYETIAGCGSNWGVWDPKWVIEANFYCDTYGLDTISVGTGIAFVMECYEAGILNKEITGGMDLSFGNAAEGMELVHQMAAGDGFGTIVGQGINRMKRIFASDYGGDPDFMQDIGMEHKGLEFSEYVTKESLTQQGGFGLTLKGPQHDEAWLIFEDIVRHSIPSFEDKALALCWFPYWRTWFGLNGLCKLPWNDVRPADNTQNPVHDPITNELVRARIPKHVENYAKYFSAVTGRQSTSEDLVADSRRVYNFQRIFCVRLGKGVRLFDSNFPYRGVGPVTAAEFESRADRYDKQLIEILKLNIKEMSTEAKMAALRTHRESQYSKLQDTVYKYRGWNTNGVPTPETVKELGIDFDDVLAVIQKANLKIGQPVGAMVGQTDE